MTQKHFYRPLTTQKVSYTDTAGTIGNAVGSQTYVVRVLCTTAAHVAIGASPTATTSDMPLAGDREEYFNIAPGEKVSAVQQSSGGDLYVTELT